jgi:hypothetical protein
MTILVERPLSSFCNNREVGRAVHCRDDDLPVEDGGASVDMPRVRSNLAKAVCPVIAAPSKHLDGGVLHMDLHPVAVELDLMHPTLAAWHPVDRRRERRFNEAGIAGLGAYCCRLLTLERHDPTP